MNQEEFITRKPNNLFLRKYISYYYFHFSPDSLLQKNFIYYPNNKNALTIYKHSKVEYGLHYSRVEPDDRSDYIFLYSGVQTKLRLAYILAPFNKIGIVFRELGINHFMDDALADISSDPIEKSFNYFGKDLIESCELIYAEKNIEKRVDLLDHFFESKFCGFQEERLKRCVQLIMNSSQKLTVKELSDEVYVSRKTLLRWFKKHLCCSVKDYIDIVQFRKSLNQYLLENNKTSLTAIALDNDYYDQPQFIKHFKKLSGNNPKTFFKNVEQFGKEDTFWTFL